MMSVTPDGGDDFGHGGACLVYQRAVLFHAFYAGGDGSDFFGGFCAALGQAAHFTGHHGKPRPCSPALAGVTAALSAGCWLGYAVDDAQ